MNISIVIPNFNGANLLRENLPAILKAQSFKENRIVEVIVVDDGSKDGSTGILQKEFSWVKVIKHKVNRGFSAAVNTGVRTARGDLICLLNSDVTPESNFLVSVSSFFSDTRVFAVSLNEKGPFGWARGIFKDGFIEHSPGPKSSTPHDTFWVSGGSGVFRRSIWTELGGMDERILSPFYWEDVDLSYRAQKRGYKLVWDSEAKVLHKHELTIGHFSKTYIQRIMERNQLLFTWKNLTSVNLLRKHITGIIKRLIKHPGYMRIVLMALSRVHLVIKARGRELKESKVSDEMVFSRF